MMNLRRYLVHNFSLKKLPYILITIFWCITMTMLIIKHYFPESFRLTPYTTPIPDKLYEENWMGAYFNGEKIGYYCRKITELNSGYKIFEKLKVRVNVMGEEKDIETVTDAETDKVFRLSSFEFALKSDMTMNIKGKVEGKNLYVLIDTGGLKTRKIIFLKEPPRLSLSVVPDILRKGLEPGSKTDIPVIDPATLSQEHMGIEVVGKDSIMYMGKRQDAYKVRGVFKGVETLLWITDKGEVLKEESPMGFSLVKETKKDAIQPGKPSIDLVAQIAVPLPNIKLPSNTDYLKIKISGIDLKGLELDGGRQTLRGDILEVKKEPLESIGENNSLFGKGVKRGLLDEYLKDTIFIQSKDPSIVSLAKDIVGDEKDVLKMTKLIYE
jgi:hypothetical protein